MHPPPCIYLPCELSHHVRRGHPLFNLFSAEVIYFRWVHTHVVMHVRSFLKTAYQRYLQVVQDAQEHTKISFAKYY